MSPAEQATAAPPHRMARDFFAVTSAAHPRDYKCFECRCLCEHLCVKCNGFRESVECESQLRLIIPQRLRTFLSTVRSNPNPPTSYQQEVQRALNSTLQWVSEQTFVQVHFSQISFYVIINAEQYSFDYGHCLFPAMQ